ncbi:hypothetical protein KTD17_11805 [Burkholderia multivorans]|uniref:hypothetical protein n=1 Tax=Burkholderia multivorans TaxID=87883 RepID=UPI001C24E973|nr:hypothetical protein [Burkholderia multivorans]MBU9133673.1 hypothetical protein [Burkholderia multivorans]
MLRRNIGHAVAGFAGVLSARVLPPITIRAPISFRKNSHYPRVSTRTPITAAITGAHDAPPAAHRHAMLHMHIAACETRNGRCLPPFDRRRHLKITI